MLLFELQIPNYSDALIGSWVIPHNLCDDIVNDFETNSSHHRQSKHYTFLPNWYLDPKIEKMYTDYVGHCLDKYKAKYPQVKDTSISWNISKPYDVKKYEPGNHITQSQFDSKGPEKGKYQRHLSWITYLHDIPNGGNIEFLYQNVTTVARKGLTYFWPSGWTHTYKEIPCESTRYVITGWIAFTQRG